MAFVDGVSWTHCAQVLADLSHADRQALKAVQADVSESLSPEALVSLQRIGLIKHNGGRWILTDNGKAVVQWC